MTKPSPPDCPIPGASGMCAPEGTGANGVLILGEALGEAEAEDGLPFRPYAAAGSVLERAIRRCGMDRSQFVVYNVVPVRPPKNWLEGAPWEAEAVAWGSQILEGVIREYRPKVILALGNVATRAATSLCGEHRSVSSLRGYNLPVSGLGVHSCVPSFHPSFLRRGAMGLLSVLMHDIKLSVLCAALRPGQTGRFYSPVLGRDFQWTKPLVEHSLEEPDVPSGYILRPSEGEAWDYLRRAESQSDCLISYDIETPRSGVTGEDESEELADSEILSIQFSMGRGTGIFMPWREPYVDVARRVLALPNPKVGCNNWRFDDPRLVAHGCEIAGQRHDVRWAWKHLQPDIKAGLQFIYSFYQEPDFAFPWKHLHNSAREQYGVMDVDATWRIAQ